jgi:hypothetical protein
LLLLSLAPGMVRYEYFEDLPWRDAFMNAAIAPIMHRVCPDSRRYIIAFMPSGILNVPRSTALPFR